jgi:lysophospholipid acyltransferase (LPLAT)-like uncharacterized protein
MSLSDRIMLICLPLLGALFVRCLGSTLRIRVVEADSTSVKTDTAPGMVYVFWHSNLLIPAYTHRNKGIRVIVSEHRDGEIGSRIARRLGHVPIRGSTTRGGLRALLEASRQVRNGHSVLITPDGPRGPLHTFHIGPLILAQRSGCPIVPVGVAAAWRIHLKSWDRFIIPLPFSRCAIYIGPGITIDKADEATRQMLEQRLVQANRTAEHWVRRNESRTRQRAII